MCYLRTLDEKVELYDLKFENLSLFSIQIRFYMKILCLLIEISGFSKMVSVIWNPKFGEQGIILNLHVTFEHGRILGRSNLKNNYKAMQNACYSESEEEVFKKLTKNTIRKKGCNQKSHVTHSNKFCDHFFSNLSFASLYLIRLE